MFAARMSGAMFVNGCNGLHGDTMNLLAVARSETRAILKSFLPSCQSRIQERLLRDRRGGDRVGAAFASVLRRVPHPPHHGPG
jgi:hypothetical protein